MGWNAVKCSSVSFDTLETMNSTSLLEVQFRRRSSGVKPNAGFGSPMLSAWQTSTLPKPNWKAMKAGESVITHQPHACCPLHATSFGPRSRVGEPPGGSQTCCVALLPLLMVATIIRVLQPTCMDLPGHERRGCPFCPQHAGNIARGSLVLGGIWRLTRRKADYKGDFQSCAGSERPAPFPLTLHWCSQTTPAKNKSIA